MAPVLAITGLVASAVEATALRPRWRDSSTYRHRAEPDPIFHPGEQG